MTFQDDNGNTLELEGSFAMTKQAVSFFNMSIRGDVSINFEVDNNSVNRNTLGYYGPQMNTQVAWTKQPFNRMLDGNVLDRGYIVIQDETEEALNCFYVSGNSNWVQLLKGLITELSFNGASGNSINYETQLSDVTINSLKSASSGIIFPMVDWLFNLKKGNELFSSRYDTLTVPNTDSSHNIPTNPIINFYPVFFLSSLMNELFQQNGLKLSGNLINDPLYKSFVITPGYGLIKRTIKISRVVATGSDQAMPLNSTTTYTSFTETSDDDNLFSSSTYLAPKNANYIVSITCVSRATTDIAGVIVRVANNYPEQIWNDGAILTFVVTAKAGQTIVARLRNINLAGTVNARINIQINIATNIGVGDYVTPDLFLPKISCLDVAKFVFNYFGCSIYYDVYSKTVTANIIEKIDTETALDWSEYYLSHRSEYTVSQAKNNHIRLIDNQFDGDIVAYNKNNIVGFGEGNILTSNTLNTQKDLATYPIKSWGFGKSINGIYLSNIPLISFSNEGEVQFSSASASAGNTSFVVSLPQINYFVEGEVVSIIDIYGNVLGYFIVNQSSGTANVVIRMTFTASFSGIIRKLKVNYNDIGFNLLTLIPNVPLTTFSTLSSYSRYDGDSLQTNIPYAYFIKPVTGLPIDGIKSNCAIENPTGIRESIYSDPTIKQLYFNKIGRFFQNPNIRCQMLLPASVFQSFDFSNFIYLRTEKLTGYFFVDSIVNYQDSNTPVEVNLYML